jgi:hypothetical protein
MSNENASRLCDSLASPNFFLDQHLLGHFAELDLERWIQRRYPRVVIRDIGKQQQGFEKLSSSFLDDGIEFLPLVCIRQIRFRLSKCQQYAMERTVCSPS